MIFLFQGGKSARVVNTVLALKSYGEWKQGGGFGVWKFGGNVKPTTTMSATKSFVRKNSEPFTNSLSRTSSLNDKSFNSSNVEWNKTVSNVDSFNHVFFTGVCLKFISRNLLLKSAFFLVNYSL